MSAPILLSLYALREKPARYEGWRVVEWTPHASGGHPSWSSEASALRVQGGDADGPLLASLLGPLDDLPRLVVCGFSAGSNSGMREVLRHPEDRAAIDAALCIDGLHSSIKSWVRDEAQPARKYFDWTLQMAPFAEAFREFCQDGKPFFATASQVAAPSGNLTATAEAWRDILTVLGAEGINIERVSAPVQIPASDGGAPVQRIEAVGCGRAQFWAFEGRTARDHVQQAQAVLPYLLNSLELLP